MLPASPPDHSYWCILLTIHLRIFGSGLQAYPEFLKGTWTFGSIPFIRPGRCDCQRINHDAYSCGFVMLTKWGNHAGCSEDKEVASLMGIDVDRIIMLTFALGAHLRLGWYPLYSSFLLYTFYGLYSGS